MNGVLAHFAESFGFRSGHRIPEFGALKGKLRGAFFLVHGLMFFFSTKVKEALVHLDDPQGGFGGEGEEVDFSVGGFGDVEFAHFSAAGDGGAGFFSGSDIPEMNFISFAAGDQGFAVGGEGHGDDCGTVGQGVEAFACRAFPNPGMAVPADGAEELAVGRKSHLLDFVIMWEQVE